MSYDLDLVVLVPGEDDRETLSALLTHRHRSLRVRRISFEILKHPQCDPGCFHTAPDLLQTFVARSRHALVVFDYRGSGQETRPARDLELDLENRLARQGWEDRARCLVLQPELEVWVWSNSPHVATALGWDGLDSLRRWLTSQGLWKDGEAKPHAAKEAVEKACRHVRLPRSSAIYRRLAHEVGLSRCQDSSFQHFRDTLALWFPNR